jgi:uncharacterized membrane protein YhaH (DUF805 family)
MASRARRAWAYLTTPRFGWTDLAIITVLAAVARTVDSEYGALISLLVLLGLGVVIGLGMGAAHVGVRRWRDARRARARRGSTVTVTMPKGPFHG